MPGNSPRRAFRSSSTWARRCRCSAAKTCASSSNWPAYVTVNDYEGQVLLSRTGWSSAEVAARVRAFIVTHGERGATIHADGRQYNIPAVQAERVVDPTGCGDAFRGGLLYGIEQGFDWETTGRLASLMGAIKIAHQGPQNYKVSREQIGQMFESAFGYRYA